MTIPTKGTLYVGSAISIPRHLYKFREFDTHEHGIDILRNDRIFFASPGTFNDPFDSHILVRFDLGTPSQIRRRLEDALRMGNPEMPSAEIRKRAKTAYLSGISANHKAVLLGQEQAINEDLGIFSLSANIGSLLSWAHYASSHSGFCIGFSTQYLQMICMGISLNDTSKVMVMGEVQYTNEYPMIDVFHSDRMRSMRLSLLTKSSEWSYEREYRMLFPAHPSTLVAIPPEAITRVVLGCRIRKDDQVRIVQVLEERKSAVKLFKAERDPFNFRLRFRHIPLSRKK
jgi:hypothetical protein